MSDPAPGRIRFPVVGVLMMLCIGNVYAWSVFRKPLEKAYGWTSEQATIPFQVSIAVFAAAMVFAGRWQDRSGPRPVAMLGGVLIGIGFVLAGLFGSNLYAMILAFGVVAGCGMGGAYVTPLATTIKWWPDRRGLLAGVVVMGMGAGSILGGMGGPHLINAIGVLPTLIVFGVVFGTVITIGGSFLRNPPADYRPPGFSAPSTDRRAPPPRRDFEPSEMMKTSSFYLIWFAFLIGSSVGLMVISQASPIGQEMAGLSPEIAGGAVLVLGIFNGLGRPSFGAISDRIGRKRALILAFAIELIALVLVLPRVSDFASLALGVSLIGFSFGGFLSVMPSLTADYFGTKNVGLNYAWVYCAWGTAGVLGPMVGVKVKGNWPMAFQILAVSVVAGMILLSALRPPRAPAATPAPESRPR